MLLGAARRFFLLLGAISAVLAAGAAVIGAALGASLNRALADAFEAAGVLLLVLGFFVGNRGPVRAKGDAVPFFGPRLLRWATAEEHRSTIAESAIFIVLGLLLVLIGLLIDNRYRII